MNAKNPGFYVFNHKRFFSMVSNFFREFFRIFLKVLQFYTGIKYCMLLNYFEFIQKNCLRSYFNFLETLKPNKEEMANSIEFYNKSCLEILFSIQ